MKSLNDYLYDVGEFSYSHWKLIISICILVIVGGLLSAIFGWVFAMIVPGFLIFVAFVLRRRYKRDKLKGVV